MSTNPNTGQELIGTEQEVNGYRFQKIIGRDVAGRYVFRAINYRQEKKAVKIIPIAQETLDRGLNQAILLSSIEHPNIANSYQFTIRKENTQLLIFMEYCQQNLAVQFKNISYSNLQRQNTYSGYKQTQRQKKQPNYPFLLHCATCIISALQYLHQKLNITHNDIRLESVQLQVKGKQRIPKLSFYAFDWNQQAGREMYLSQDLTAQFDRNARINQLQYTKGDDLWALGILLIQIFSMKRINEILQEYQAYGKRVVTPAFRLNSFNTRALFDHLKFNKIADLVRLLLQDSQKRPSIGQFRKIFISATQSSSFSIIKPLANLKKEGMKQRQNQMSRDKQRQWDKQRQLAVKKVQSFANVNEKKPKKRSMHSRQKYEQVVQKQKTKKSSNDVFRLDDVKDRTKLKILNLSEMNITKIEPVPYVPNLQWLYLQTNHITKIQNLDYARLKGLNLGFNKITKIQNLDRLTSLQELYLQNNQIQKIENLQQLRNLKWLFLSHNKITIIENLDQLVAIKTVALKDNPIDEYRDVNAQAIRALKDLHVELYLK